MAGQQNLLSEPEPSTTADEIIAAFHCACDFGNGVVARRLLAILENMLARRRDDGHKEVAKLYAEVALAQAALSSLVSFPDATIRK
jgi:hypothetical protein